MNDRIEGFGKDDVEGQTSVGDSAGASPDVIVVLDDAVDTTGEVVLTSSDAGTSEDDEAPVAGTERPKVTFMGNTYDMASLLAAGTGIFVLTVCFTCGQIVYCLPVVPVLLGILGLVTAKQSIDQDRTRLWSWLGIGGGGIVLVIGALAIVAYAAFIVLVIWMNLSANPYSYGY